MSTIDPQRSLAALVLDQPDRAELFERLGFDYCCDGQRSLAAACSERDLDIDTFVQILEAWGTSIGPTGDYDYDFRTASLGTLCDHIVEAHHEPLRRELPRLADRLATVVRVHGSHDPRLEQLQETFGVIVSRLVDHLDREERLLFPACRALETSDAPVDRDVLLDELEHDHADVGQALPLLREFAGGYDVESAHCETHRALLEGLLALERDLHRHIHEENNILFPQARSRLAG